MTAAVGVRVRNAGEGGGSSASARCGAVRGAAAAGGSAVSAAGDAGAYGVSVVGAAVGDGVDAGGVGSGVCVGGGVVGGGVVGGGVGVAGGVAVWLGFGVGVLAGGFGWAGLVWAGFGVVFTGFGLGFLALAFTFALAGADPFEGVVPAPFVPFASGAASRRPLSASTRPCSGCSDALGRIEVTWTLDEPDERSAPAPSPEPDCWSAHAVPPKAAAEATAAADSLSRRERPRRCLAWLRM